MPKTKLTRHQVTCDVDCVLHLYYIDLGPVGGVAINVGGASAHGHGCTASGNHKVDITVSLVISKILIAF